MNFFFFALFFPIFFSLFPYFASMVSVPIFFALAMRTNVKQTEHKWNINNSKNNKNKKPNKIRLDVTMYHKHIR